MHNSKGTMAKYSIFSSGQGTAEVLSVCAHTANNSEQGLQL